MLIEFMSDFLNISKENYSMKKAKTTLSFLRDYTNMHFKHEEILMEDIKYDGLEKHHEQHIKFCMNIDRIETDIIRESDIEKSFAQTRFLLYTWYTNHINNTDRLYVDLFKKNQAAHTKPGSYKLWDKSMLVGIPKIDREHKALVEIIEDLIWVISQNKHNTATKVKRTMLFLENYTKLHFSHEEDYLEENNNNALQEHKVIHQVFTDNINIINDQLKSHPNSKGALEAVQTLLLKWLLDHICDEDQNFA